MTYLLVLVAASLSTSAYVVFLGYTRNRSRRGLLGSWSRLQPLSLRSERVVG